MLVIQIFFTPHCYITDYYDYWQKKKKNTHKTKQKKLCVKTRNIFKIKVRTFQNKNQFCEKSIVLYFDKFVYCLA